MMKMLVLALLLSSCMRPKVNVTNNSSTPIQADSSILGVWTATNPSSRVPTLNLSGLQLNTIQSIVPVIDCLGIVNGGNDQSGNSGPSNGVAKNQVGIQGSLTNGIIQFGPLSHSDQTPSNVCYTLGQEEFTYDIRGNQLTFCDFKYSSCSTYTQ